MQRVKRTILALVDTMLPIKPETARAAALSGPLFNSNRLNLLFSEALANRISLV